MTVTKAQFLVASGDGRAMAFNHQLEPWFDYNCNLWTMDPFFEFSDYMAIVKPSQEEENSIISISNINTG